MSEHDEDQPLTRRERRLREMAETGAQPTVDPNQGPEAAGDTGTDAGEYFDISPVDETGRQRTRRELRELRDQAIAAREAEQAEIARAADEAAEADRAAAVEAERAAAAEAAEAERARAEAEQAEAERIAAAEQAEAERLEAERRAEAERVEEVSRLEELEQTQAFSYQELADATESNSDQQASDAEHDVDSFISAAQQREPERTHNDLDFDAFLSGRDNLQSGGGVEATATEQAPSLAELFGATPQAGSNESAIGGLFVNEVDGDADDEGSEDADAENVVGGPDVAPAVAEGKRSRLPWRRKGDKGAAEVIEASDEQPAQVTSNEQAGSDSFALDSDEDAEVEYEFGSAVPGLSGSAGFGQSNSEAEAPEVSDGSVEEQPSQSYSFPDIVPLDDPASVFDDPIARARRVSQQEGERAEAGFDALISNAIAQEGDTSSTGSANSAALILPSMPQSDSLTGPIGETGELFLTGSIELPKSLGETGGHSMLHDSVEHDPIDDLGLGFGAAASADSGTSPVSANRAVSARVIPGPVLSETSRERSKVPTVLMITGGGLLLVIAGLAVWGFGSGIFG